MAQDLENVTYEEEFILNPRGLKLFTCSWMPTIQDPRALIFLCHGYGMECSISMKGTGIQLAKAGYAVYGIDYEGHGKSHGLQGYIPSFDYLVNDCCDYFTSVCEKKENENKLRYLLGESMGGAVALHLHRKKPKYWDGAVFVAPMCKIADELEPHPIVIKILTQFCRIIPTWKIIPTQDIIDISIKNPQVRKEVSLPFIIVHGGDDIVTDPSVSKLLFESAISTDKTFKLYPGMWHMLTLGEPPESIELVFSDIIGWLDERTIRRNSRSKSDDQSLDDSQGEKIMVEA